MIDVLYYTCRDCGGKISMKKEIANTCKCINPKISDYNVGHATPKPSATPITFDQVLKIVESWQFFWMNQTIDEKDTKHYRERAAGIDANMRHNLAERIIEVLK